MTSRRSFLARAGLLAAGLGGGWWLREHVLWPAPLVAFADAAQSSGWLPFVTARALVPTVRAVIGGREVTALIDSGAQYSVIDQALFDDLGGGDGFRMPLLAYGMGGGAQLGRGATLAVAVGGLALSGLKAAILDLGPLADPAGLATPLVLGQDVLGQLVLELDPPGRRLRLLAPAAHRPWPGATAAPVARRGGAMITEITIEGAAVTAVVDTGASALLALSRDTAAAVGLLDGRAARRSDSVVLGGTLGAGLVRARTVTFADVLFRDVEVAIYPDVLAPGYPDGLLGMAALRGRRAALDLGAGRLHLARALDLTLGGPA